MRIGLPKEIKDNENRVGMTPGAVKALTRRGHQVLVQTGAGAGSSLSDEEYLSAGAEIVPYAEDAWAAQMVVKVKEPIASEYQYLRPDLILFTYLHLASDKPLTDALLASGTTGIAYETVQTGTGQLPLLTPMSEVAGRMATQVGATYLQKSHGGRGVLMGGVPGVAPANVVILGAGIVGTNAARVAVGLGAQVTVLDISHDRLKYLDDIYRGQLQTRISDEYNIEEVICEADLVIGAVLIPGGRAPWLITRNMLPTMPKGSSLLMWPLIKAGAWKPLTQPPIAIRLMKSMAWCITVLPTCREPFLVPVPLPLTTKQRSIHSILPMKAWKLCVKLRLCNTALIPTVAG